MKKILTIAVLLIAVGLQAQHKVSEKIAALYNEKATFTHVDVLTPRNDGPDEDMARALSRQTLAKLNLEQVNEIVLQRYQNLQLEIPYLGQTVVVDLYRVDPFHTGFHVDTDKAADVAYQPGVYYRGIVHDQPQSVAAISFFNNEMSGIVSSPALANLVIGKVDRVQNVDDYVVYSDADLRTLNGFTCSVKDDNMPKRHDNQASRDILSDRCVTMYFEIDHNLYTAHSSSVNATTNWFTAVFNNVQTLYDNEGITVSLKSVYVWTTPDPYDGIGDQSSDYLYKFHEVRPVFDGDVGQLVGIDPGGLGGVAVTINGLCSEYNFSYSDIVNSFSNVPTYSWTVQVITHEMGHLLGSPHTHACVWNGNNTSIDGCGTQAGYQEGNCATGPIPASGTIMSYCHLIGGVGIDFSNGFGPQPAQLIYDTVNASQCLSLDCINTCINTITGLQVSNPTPTSVAATWDDINGNGMWEVSVAPFNGPENWVTVNTNSYSATQAFAPNTFYKVKVRPLCDAATAAAREAMFVTSANWCDGATLTDSGGATGAYTDNELYIRTLIPNLPNHKIKIDFTAFNLELDYDYLSLYDGPDIDAPLIGDFTGTTITTPVESTAPDGSLTLKFYSDEGVTTSGYVGQVSCTTTLGLNAQGNIDFSYAPNPTTGSVNIISNTDMTGIRVYNVQGQLLYERKNNGLGKFVDLAGFASGTYFFKIVFGEKEANFRIVKN